MAESDAVQEKRLAAAAAGPNSPPVRQRFGSGIAAGSSAAAWAEAWLRMLLVQDGSATLLCETIADGPVQLEVVHQKVTTSVPRQVRAHLPGSAFIERQVCMSHAGQVMMDNLSYVALERLDPEVRRHLEQGLSPIGYIFDVKRTRKRPVTCPEAVLTRLWQRAGVPDPAAARSYVLEIEATSSMLITEVYRAGMCLGLPQS
ncbi:chorismate--pyruvate lyase family protein [Cribrihabitans neustonicus]|uniref:chorismate--pyruvate lyase family protein n=1 Tax=Cribrihabitans neustonicus TaxID=1429085 RepID=UPI003B5CB666